MSPADLNAGEDLIRFPRVSGDEPGYGHGAVQGEGFSPRERG